MAGGLSQVPADWDRPAPKDVTEIDLIPRDQAQTDSLNLVRQVEAPENQKTQSKEKARFMSENEQRVLLETQARRTGLTQNGGKPLKPDSWMNQKPRPQAAETAPRTKSLDGYEPIPLPRPGSQAFNEAPSLTGELLPDDVSIGDFTALNTDRYQFYSFYARIEELVRFRWESALNRAVDKMDPGYVRNVIGRKTWKTIVEFWILPDGTYHSAHLLKESGIPAFDQAVVFAFRDARFFPNPPPELVQKDGYIHLQYGFNVHWSPALLSGR